MSSDESEFPEPYTKLSMEIDDCHPPNGDPETPEEIHESLGSDETVHMLEVEGNPRWIDAYIPGEDQEFWADTPSQVTFEISERDIASGIHNSDADPDEIEFVVDGKTERPIPFYVIQSAVEHAPEDAEYAIVRSDGDHDYAETLKEANELADAFRSSIEHLAPIGHTVQMIALQEVSENVD